MESPIDTQIPRTHDESSETARLGDEKLPLVECPNEPSVLNEQGIYTWSQDGIDSLSWVHKLPAEVRDNIYDQLLDSLDPSIYRNCRSYFKYNKSRIGVVVFDHLTDRISYRHNETPYWFDNVNIQSSIWNRGLWYKNQDTEIFWVLNNLFRTMNPEFRDELKRFRYRSRVLELSALSWYGYDPQDLCRYLAKDIEEYKNYRHLSFDYLSPMAKHLEDHDNAELGVDTDNPENSIEGRMDPQEAFIKLCSYIASNLNPMTITLWMRFSEDEIHEILDGEDANFNAISSAIRKLKARHSFSINMFVLHDDRTPSTPEKYASMCMGYTRQLQEYLMPNSLRKM